MCKIYLVSFHSVPCCDEYFFKSSTFYFCVQEYKMSYYLLLPTSESAASGNWGSHM